MSELPPAPNVELTDGLPAERRESSVTDEEIYDHAVALQLIGKEWRGRHDEEALKILAANGVFIKILADRNREDLIEELHSKNRASSLPGVRSLPLR